MSSQLEQDAASSKQEMPKQLRPDFRSPEQQERLRQADELAWQLLVRLRFAAPAALHQLAYSPDRLGFAFGTNAFRARMQKHQAKGHWVVDRLGSRPESILYLSRRAPDVYESTYGQPAPAFNADSARRGWLRSWAWAELLPWKAEPVSEQLKMYARDIERWRARPKTFETQNFVNLLEKVERGEPVPASFDYIRNHANKFDRLWLLVEEPHKSVEAQLAVLATMLSFNQAITRRIIYRPVDELSAWSTSRRTWVRKSGRLARALGLMKEMGLQIDENSPVRHMQTEP